VAANAATKLVDNKEDAGAESDECCYNSDKDYNELNSAIDAAAILAQVIAPGASTVPSIADIDTPLAKELEPGEVTIPLLRGSKHRKTANHLYKDYVKLSDADELSDTHELPV
jgi:hypothetical protein